jgi:hypothetical protein
MTGTDLYPCLIVLYYYYLAEVVISSCIKRFSSNETSVDVGRLSSTELVVVSCQHDHGRTSVERWGEKNNCECAWVYACARAFSWPTITLQVEVKLKLIYDRRSVGQSVLVSGSHLESMTRFLFPDWRLRVSWCVAPSLTRRWVCNLLVLVQLLLGLARAVTLG